MKTSHLRMAGREDSGVSWGFQILSKVRSVPPWRQAGCQVHCWVVLTGELLLELALDV